MDIRQIVPGFSVAPQIRPEELAEAAAMGFRTLVCNRPDGEEPGQPSAGEMAAAAEAAGMEFHLLPVYPGAFTPDLVAGTLEVLAATDQPVLAYCRSGTRSATLWSLAMAGSGEVTPEAILAATAQAGYDLSPLAPHLRARAQNGG